MPCPRCERLVRFHGAVPRSDFASMMTDFKTMEVESETESFDQPPAYGGIESSTEMRADRGYGRPTNLWRWCTANPYDLYPWVALKAAKWCLKDDSKTEYELQCETPGMHLMNKFGWFRGSAGHGAPAFTYKPINDTIKSADGSLSIKCEYSADRRTNTQRMAFNLGGMTYRWYSDRCQSTMFGKIWDTTHNKLLDAKGQELASLTWLQSNGMFDGCMRRSPDTETIINDELLLLTFSVYMYRQWEMQHKEVDEGGYAGRAATCEAVEKSLSPGRMMTYCYRTMEDVDKFRHMVKERMQKERRGGGGYEVSNTATIATMAAT